MTLAINRKEIILEKLETLTGEQQDAVLEFIEFLRYKAQKQEQQQVEDKQPISAYEAAQQWAGCVDSGLGDLSTNKAYLEGFGK
ncbi:hypothetical protein ACE1CI_33430 [Aerosakkonemataceae cyanobacterium BLCC-F50]|uniref:DUF2281 domain-containing protein n=1 Tax=Floridaenema flaviceps BLCC-F50 TaxID=3153642 RepID=A0ABV4Y3G0_9CYAN